MRYRCIDVWDSEQEQAIFLTDVLHNDYDRIIVFGQNESEIPLLRNHPILHPLPIESVIGAGEIILPKPYPITSYWPEWFLMKTITHLKSRYILPKIYRCTLVPKKYHFISMNGRPHWHRCYMIDQLAKHNLIDNNAVSWYNFGYGTDPTNFPWQYFSPRKIILEDDCFIPEQDWATLPKEYAQSHFQLISETVMDATFITEKTVTALLNFKPFIVSGSKHFYKQLRILGFEDYDELFDYSFDEIDDDKLRIEMVVDNVNRLSKLSLYELERLVEPLKDKIIYNYTKAIQISSSYDHWPEQGLEILDIYKSTGRALNKSICNMYDTQVIHA